MRPWLWKTALVVVAVLLVGVVPPSAGQQDPVTGAQEPAGGRVPPWSTPPPNDRIGDAIEITGPGISPSIWLTVATALPGLCESRLHPWLQEQTFLGLPLYPAGGNTLWWKWTPDRTGWVIVDTSLSRGPAHRFSPSSEDWVSGPFDTVLGVYQGRSLCPGPFHLRLVRWDDDSGRRYMSRVRFRAYEGVQYYVVVAGGDLGGQTCFYFVGASFQCFSVFGGDVVVRLRNT